MINKSNLESSPLEKFKHANGLTPDGKHYSVAIVLRKNGRIEFYSDYMLVHEFYDKQKICVDIKTDD